MSKVNIASYHSAALACLQSDCMVLSGKIPIISAHQIPGKMRAVFLFGYILALCSYSATCKITKDPQLIVVTVASDATDGYVRFMRSAEIYGYTVKTLGMNKPWLGGDLESGPGGGYKINLLKKWLRKYRNDTETLILFTDSYDVIFTGSPKSVMQKFRQKRTRILFSAEQFCWPDTSLADHYPPVMSSSKYLNSGGFMGNAQSIYELITTHHVLDTDDDQLYYTKLFLDSNMRHDLGIQLDYESEIFQTLHGSEEDVKIHFRDDDSYIVNTEHHTEPAVIHGNGRSKEKLNMWGNYIARSWTPTKGCQKCAEGAIDLSGIGAKPVVCMALFIERPSPFLPEFFERVSAQDYPKERIHLLIHSQVEYHRSNVSYFLDHSIGYASVVSKSSKELPTEADARNSAAYDSYETLSHDCDFHMSVDSEAMLSNPETISLLVGLNRTVVAPLLVRPGSVWSNFWGAVGYNGFYARSEDYLDILNHSKRGIWHVPLIRNAYLIRADVIKKNFVPFIAEAGQDVDITWGKNMRKQDRFMYVSNLHEYGHLLNSDNFDIALSRPEFYQLTDNKLEWENRYLHKDYRSALDSASAIEQPCTDVYWFPLVSPKYAEDLITIMEDSGHWSNGTNLDPRLDGGYENVPTRDVHMKQVGLEKQWQTFLRTYITPMQLKLYPGYHRDPSTALMNFVVRYKPDEQPALRPHHDASTYTINIALNRPNVDYEGGGCRFLRYNCSVVDTRLGWTLIHPGRLTHYHEGLPVTKGTRYIMVSFVDP